MPMELIYEAWDKFVFKNKTEDMAVSGVNPIIQASWQRCVDRELNPNTVREMKISKRQLLEKKEAKQSLIKVTKPFIQELYELVKGSGFVVMLLDEDVCVLELSGDEDILRKCPFFRVGEIWSEEIKGTNAMGLVKTEKRPVQVYATEHYARENHKMTCSAAPIWGDKGELLGILDVSGDFNKAHTHTLGMVVAAAKAIQNELSLKAANLQIINSFQNINEVLDTISDGIVSFDRDGLITSMNQVAIQILNADRADYKGKSFRELLKNNQIIDIILTTGETIDNQEFILQKNRKRSHFLLSACPIVNHRQDICGGVANLREIQNVHKMINQVVGARALLTFGDILGESDCLLESTEIAQDVAQSRSSIILYGESGTGKEMFAQAIHNASNYSAGPFIAINCGAIPRDLMPSELFGYEEGAFTGAKRGGNAGKFELANGGTLFLDEIGDMPLDTQVSLLRVLQEKQVVRIGGYRSTPIDVRIIAASNKDLKEEVRKGNFREDLYYRLNVISITIPPLRNRGEDILLLANYYIKKFSTMLGFAVSEIETSAQELLEGYLWPGNVRELANAMERAVNLAKGEVVNVEHLPQAITKKNTVKTRLQEINSLEKYESKIIAEALEAVNWNISRCASLLGISRNTLYRKIDKYGIVNESASG